MKISHHYLLPAACALGVLAFSATAPAMDCTMPGCGSGMNPTVLSDAGTNAIPDLLKTCPVSGDKLGTDMGPPYVFVYKGQEVKLCCSGCKKDFDKDPAKYLKLIRAADKKK